MGRAHERAPARELYTAFRDFRAIHGLARGGVAVTGRFNEKRPGTTTPTRHGILRNVYVISGQFSAGKGDGCRDWAFRVANNAQARHPAPARIMNGTVLDVLKHVVSPLVCNGFGQFGKRS